jgi:hypothetical protein
VAGEAESWTSFAPYAIILDQLSVTQSPLWDEDDENAYGGPYFDEYTVSTHPTPCPCDWHPRTLVASSKNLRPEETPSLPIPRHRPGCASAASAALHAWSHASEPRRLFVLP